MRRLPKPSDYFYQPEMRCGNRIAFIIGLLGLFFGVLAGFFFSLVHDLPEINRLKQYKPPLVTTVFSSENKMIDRFYAQKRFPVPLNEMPDDLINAIITIEDRYFFSHSGVNVKAITRAAVKDIASGRFKEGASTITQQLAKTLFLTNEKSFVRKIREAILSLQIERRYTKNEILELYLNQIYMGSGAYGVEAASRIYFGKPVSEVTLGQAALLAGLPKAPSIYSPLKNMDLAVQRRNLVLFQMVKAGTINTAQYEFEKNQEIAVPERPEGDRVAGYFTDYVKRVIRQQFDSFQLYTQGLNIHTTLDFDLQQTAAASVLKRMGDLKRRMEKSGLETGKLQCAVVALDIKSGGITCMIGGTDYTMSSFNRVIQALRQPGSAFKPFVYAVAVQEGYKQYDTLLDAPLSYAMPGGGTWDVQNFSRSYSGMMTLRKALALSKNTPAVRLIDRIGPEKVVEFAAHAGILSRLAPNLSLALGTSEVNLMELTAAYIPFANMGIRVQPFSIVKITDSDSRLVFRHSVQKQTVLSREHAAIVTDMLKAVVKEGTGKRASTIKREIGGKTGTTDQFRDALFIGFSPDTALGVWVGNDDSKPLGKNETGAKAALPIWTDIMAYLMSGSNRLQYFDIPDGLNMVYMNPDSGRLSKTKKPGYVKILERNKG